MKVPFFDPAAMHAPLREALLRAMQRVLDSTCYVRGGEVERFEQAFAAHCGTAHAMGTGNGLDALHIALRVLGVGPGDEVIVPANTYIATVLAVMHAGATPVFAEPDERTCNLSPSAFLAAITPRTKAVVPVHLYGRPCDMDHIVAIARRHGLFVVEDNAQAHGARWKGRRTGGFGDINATSFYPTKNLGALGDGGAVTTDRPEFERSARAWANYGSTERHHHVLPGFNSRLDELQAALLQVKLEHLDEWNRERRRLASVYSSELAKVPELELPTEAPDEECVYHLYVVRTPYRDGLREHLARNGVEALVHYPVPPHLQPALVSLGHGRCSFPITERMARTVLSLPLHPGLSGPMQAHVIQAVRSYAPHFQ